MMNTAIDGAEAEETAFEKPKSYIVNQEGNFQYKMVHVKVV